MNFGDERLPVKFWNKLQPCPMTGCWLWSGAMNQKGYGSHGRRAPHSGSKLTHRFTFEHEFGALPSGTELDHRACRTRSCANPHHMEPVTHRVNVQRGAAKKTHCVRGHELAGDNLMPANRGKAMRCVQCVVMAQKTRNALARAATAAKPPRLPRPKKMSGVCGRGHSMSFNGRRLVCRECSRNRGKPPVMPIQLGGGRANTGATPVTKVGSK